ncbi:FAD binding domain-containing protein [Aspergillus undulatus]|uniref:FAD binding domain-containing protein n=1 Tax=Aspergillus undulatus TaxID=1810928 RepID=UPI003CCD47EA
MSRVSRTALVTGGGRGCGLAFARGLADAGADVAVFDVIERSAEFDAIAKDYNVRTAYYTVDVSSPSSLESGFEHFQKDFNNKLDICVPCAGINRHHTFLDFPYEEHEKLLSINVLGLFFTAQHAAKQMIANRTKHGSIILVASMASHVAVRSQLCSAYCGSKGAVKSMTPAIAKELAPYGIRVNAISPGYVNTEMTAAFGHLLEGWKTETINGRIAEPDDIMGACVFLASDASSYMTGQEVIVDGGVTRISYFNCRPRTGDYNMKRSASQAGLRQNKETDRTMVPGANDQGFTDAVPAGQITVVVVGAGPSGLMLAVNLVRFGIKTLILDDRPDRTSTGKADGIQPKTIETLKQLRLADPLLKNGARVYDISFWDSTSEHSLSRKGRQIHYPDHLVGASDPYILLAHQGMLEDVLIDDLAQRGVTVQRDSPFISSSRDPSGRLNVIYEDRAAGEKKVIRADYLVGCDGARSRVREFIPDAQLEGEMTNASWGVLDGVIETDFPDLWSKVAVRSHTVGSILWIPRERGMTRLYVELSATAGERVDKAKATPEYVIARAREAMKPFTLEWKSIEWFGNYVVGQRVARHFADPNNQIFIAGDAGHCHSALAAQGANTSMHDSFNLAWKINLVSRGLASPSLLGTYEAERRKIANDLIAFDAGHCAAFEAGEAALAKNFDENIRFISGVGAEYDAGLLTRPVQSTKPDTGLRPGALMLPAKVTRYIDANPVDIQLDIPLLGQFKLYFMIPDVSAAKSFLSTVCGVLGDPTSSLSKGSSLARASYQSRSRGWAPGDAYAVPERYTAVSDILTLSLVTSSKRESFEIADLPLALQMSRWTVYLDDVDGCTKKWVGELAGSQADIVLVRPDGYIGALSAWDVNQGAEAGAWVEECFGFLA